MNLRARTIRRRIACAIEAIEYVKMKNLKGNAIQGPKSGGDGPICLYVSRAPWFPTTTKKNVIEWLVYACTGITGMVFCSCFLLAEEAASLLLRLLLFSLIWFV